MSSPIDRTAHWQKVHETKNASEVSWYQPSPALSLELIERYCPDVDASLLDVGGGISRLVDGLLERGYGRVAVLDISEASLSQTRKRLGKEADEVRWIVGDVLEADLGGNHALWHDRAVFHFLTAPRDRERYVERLCDCLDVGGHAVMATFADDGPTRCSGLDVVRYSTESMHEQLGTKTFRLEHAQREVHVTPAGKEQRFQFGVFRRQ